MDMKIVDKELMESAEKISSQSGIIIETPMLSNVASEFNLPENIELYLKLENKQTTGIIPSFLLNFIFFLTWKNYSGSFKIRGVLNQFENLNLDNDSVKLVTFSAGNYGKAFAFMCARKGLKGKVIVPKTAAESRVLYMQDQGCQVEKADSGEDLLRKVDESVKQGWTLLHPLDDIYLLAGYLSYKILFLH